MNCRRSIGLMILTVAIFGSAAMARSVDEDEKLDRKAVLETLKAADRDLKAARRAHRAGDDEGVRRSLENYSERMEAIDRSLTRGPMRERDREEVSERVAKATSKHTGVLEELRTQVPVQGRRGIERALEVSRRGNETALANLERKRERQDSERRQRGVRSGEERRQGPPSNVGRSGNSGRPGGAAAPSRGPSTGRPGRP